MSNKFSKVSEADSHLYVAQQLNTHDDPIEAWKHVEDARHLLQEFLSESTAYTLPADPATTAAGQKVEKWRADGNDIRIISQLELKEIFGLYIK